MKIYGVALLASCYFAGLILGEILSNIFNIDGNLGGVGFAMLFLILLSDWLKKKNLFHVEYESGIGFWTSMYIPIVIAMASIQNVHAALSSGTVALVAGTVATSLCFVVIPVLIKLIKKNAEQ